MANTLISYDGLPAYLNNSDMNNITLYTNANVIYVNKNATNMFYSGTSNSAFINYSTIKQLNFSHVQNAKNMFYRVAFKGQPDNIIFDFPNITDATALFFETNINSPVILGDNCTNITNMFRSCTFLNQNIVLPNSIIDANNAFCDCSGLVQAITNFPDQLSNGQRMFYLSGIISIDGKAENLKDMRNMFKNCRSLTHINAYFNKATNCFGAFSNAGQNSQNLIANITFGSNASILDNAFNGCTNIEGDFYFYSEPIQALNMFNSVSSAFRKNLHVVNFTGFLGNAAANSITGNVIRWDGNSSVRYNTSRNIYIYNDL